VRGEGEVNDSGNGEVATDIGAQKYAVCVKYLRLRHNFSELITGENSSVFNEISGTVTEEKSCVFEKISDTATEEKSCVFDKISDTATEERSCVIYNISDTVTEKSPVRSRRSPIQ
jgi:hypothetical protein